ncbi:MAG: 4Fe-4S dicluster domain-containing protein [Anaerolineae bacterium]|nr:4Fe-4S dicluster domain-containing protein [Anaerolineae bacterium]
MRVRISGETVRGDFVKEIEAISGVNLMACNQCGRCSAGCPVAFTLDVQPNQVIRMAQLGMEEVLASATIWTCAACLTCVARCPKGIDLPRVMEALRQISLRHGDDHLRTAGLDADLLTRAPQMAIIGGLRKYTR